MKHAVLDAPYARFGSMCSDIDRWLGVSLPKLDIEKYLYREGIGRFMQTRRGSCARRADNSKIAPPSHPRIQ